MKISFRGNNQTQQPVMMTQTEMKNFKSRKAPVLKLFLIVLGISASLFIVYTLYTKNTIYTYGIVSGKTEVITAVFPIEVQEITVRKGNIVNKNDLLFTQFFIDGAGQINEAEANLKNRLNELKLITSTIKNASKPNHPELFKKKLDVLLRKQKGAAISRQQVINELRYEKNRIQTLSNATKERYENIVKLHQLDAATLSQVKTSAAERDLRSNEYELSRRKYNQMLMKHQLEEQQEQWELRELETRLEYNAVKLQADYETLLADIKAARIHLRQLEKKYGKNHYRAPFDAIITDVNVNNGSVVAPGAPILSLVSLNALWVDVYVEAEKASKFTRASKISLFADGSRRPITGEISEKGRVELRVPPLLNKYLRGVTSAVYFNVAFENTDQILPGNIVRVIVK